MTIHLAQDKLTLTPSPNPQVKMKVKVPHSKQWLPVIDKGVHQKPLFHHFAVLWFFADQVPVVVVRDHDAPAVRRQIQDVPIIIAHHSLPSDSARGRKHQNLLFFQLKQNLLIWKHLMQQTELRESLKNFFSILSGIVTTLYQKRIV